MRAATRRLVGHDAADAATLSGRAPVSLSPEERSRRVMANVVVRRSRRQGRPLLRDGAGPEDHLDEALGPRVELRIRVRGRVEREVVGHDEARPRAAGGDEIAQVRAVPQHRSLAGAERDPLFPQLSERDLDLSPLGVRVLPARVLRDVEAHDADVASRVDDADEVFEHAVRLLAGRVLPVDGLEADGLDPAHDAAHLLAVVAQAPGGPAFHDLRHRVALREVDRRRADLLRSLQSVGDVIDDVHLRRPEQDRAIRGHEADGPRPEHGHGRARLHRRQIRPEPACREDVGQEHEVVLPRVARRARQDKAVEVGEGDPEKLRLAAAEGAEPHVPVGAAVRVGVHGEACGCIPAPAVEARPAGHVEGHDHAVTALDPRHGAADLGHDPERLVAEHDAGHRDGAAVVHVKIAPAHGGRGDPHQSVGRLLDPRIGHLLDRDRARPLQNHGFHDILSRGEPAASADGANHYHGSRVRPVPVHRSPRSPGGLLRRPRPPRARGPEPRARAHRDGRAAPGGPLYSDVHLRGGLAGDVLLGPAARPRGADAASRRRAEPARRVLPGDRRDVDRPGGRVVRRRRVHGRAGDRRGRRHPPAVGGLPGARAGRGPPGLLVGADPVEQGRRPRHVRGVLPRAAGPLPRGHRVHDHLRAHRRGRDRARARPGGAATLPAAPRGAGRAAHRGARAGQPGAPAGAAGREGAERPSADLLVVQAGARGQRLLGAARGLRERALGGGVHARDLPRVRGAARGCRRRSEVRGPALSWHGGAVSSDILRPS